MPAAAGVALTADPDHRGPARLRRHRGAWPRRSAGVGRRRRRRVGRDRRAGERCGASPSGHRADQAARWRSEARAIARCARHAPGHRVGDRCRGPLWILQARPMTALPPDVSWTPPAPGAFTRQYRFGEWISEPVTPLFESWLLTTMEERMHAFFREQIGQVAPQPLPRRGQRLVLLLDELARAGGRRSATCRAMPVAPRRGIRALWRASSRRPFATASPSSSGCGAKTCSRAIARRSRRPRAGSRHCRSPSFPALDRRAGRARRRVLRSIAALAGAAYKMEINLGRLLPAPPHAVLGGSHLPLLTGFALAGRRARHAVASLDWWYPAALDRVRGGRSRPRPTSASSRRGRQRGGGFGSARRRHRAG